MDNTPTPTNQPNPAGNETPEIPTTPATPTAPAPETPETPEVPETPQEPAAPVATTAGTAEATETTTATTETVTPATEVVATSETVVATEAPAVSEPAVSEPTTAQAPITSETQPISTPVTPEPAVTPATPNPFASQAPSSSAAGPQKKSGLPVGLIIGLAIGGVVLLGGIVTAIILLFFGGKVDYEATYKSFDAVETSMDAIDYGDCYKVHSRIDSSYTSSSEYGDYITGCVEELVALESATSEFGKSSGAKHDEDIKKAYEAYKSILDSIYTKKSELESQLSIYNTYHEFYLTIENASTDVKSLESAIISAASLFEDTKNSALTEFAKGFREKGLAYVRAIDNYRNGSGTSYSDIYDKMEDFTDYIENNAPEINDVTSLDFTKMNDLSSAYYDLYDAVRDAYYDHVR